MFLVLISAQLQHIHIKNDCCIAVFWWENLMVDVGVDGWLILELIFNKQGGRGGAWTGLV
jgi:hypothetical protein